MAYKGPAIKGGCVTWRSHPATGPGTLAGKLSRWQDRYGVLFAVMVQFLLRVGAKGKNFKILIIDLQALCQSFERSVGLWGFGNVHANITGRLLFCSLSY